MPSPPAIESLPAFVALDAHAVQAGERRGASLQLHDSYFEGRTRALEAVEDSTSVERHLRTVRESRSLYDDVTIDFETLTAENLWDASRRYREILQRLPEVQYLESWYPGTCFVLPEWLPKPTTVEYGARVYFFRDDDAPDPEDVLAENVEATVDDDRAAFERYQGRLHGYPDCCIERFENPQTYAFFSRGFFPEPGCDVARGTGLSIYETLAERVPEALVEDFFRFNVGWNYLLSAGVDAGESAPPAPGRLGREHRWFYLPLRTMSSAEKYREAE